MDKISNNVHYKYARYIWLHKKYVFIECWKLGIPWLGLIHDLSKFKGSEWVAYAQYFYGMVADIDKTKKKYNYDKAWLNHQHINKHHWQRWVIKLDDGGEEYVAMDDCYRREMLADWRGAGKAIKKINPELTVLSTKDWYLQNKDNIKLHPETREWVENQLDIRKSQNA